MLESDLDWELIIVEDVNNFIVCPSLYFDNYQNIGVFGQNGKSNTTLLKKIVAQATQIGLPVFGINLNKILDSRFYIWENTIKGERVNKDIWGVDDNSDKGSTWISELVAEASQFDKSILFINDCTALLKNSETSQYLGKLCSQSKVYGIQVVLVAESSHSCSQRIIKNVGTRLIVISAFYI